MCTHPKVSQEKIANYNDCNSQFFAGLVTVVKILPWLHVFNTVEPLYNRHFGTSHFWVIFAVIQRFSSFRGKIVLAWYHWDCKTCP